MATKELVDCIKSLYGGFESVDLVCAVEDGVVNRDEQEALSAILRESNYHKMAQARRDSAPRVILAEKDKRNAKRKAALTMTVEPGMVLRGSTWVRI